MGSPPPLPLPPPAADWRGRASRALATAGVDHRWVLGAAAVVAVAVLAFAAAHTFAGRSGPPVEASLPRATPGSTATAATDAGAELVVAAAGAVQHPGVYRVAAGARVNDVIAAAGGTTADADADRINLAAKVADGDRVYVPRKGEAGDPVVAGVSGGQGAPAILDLNAATAEQLDGLPGIGPATAKAIVDYRSQHGRFKSVDDLLQVRGIGDAKLAQLRPHVRV